VQVAIRLGESKCSATAWRKLSIFLLNLFVMRVKRRIDIDNLCPILCAQDIH
jgi:hypothetical protein